MTKSSFSATSWLHRLIHPGRIERYSAVARWLHWLIALLVILNIIGGLFHESLHGLPIMPFHKAAGITVIFLTLVRIGWRIGHRPPPLPAAMVAWQKGAAHLVHWLFYLLLLIVPLTGWIMVSPGPRPLTWFGLFAIPKFAVTKGSDLVHLSGGGHGPLGIVFGVLVVVHILAALWHQYLLRDNVLRRML